MVFTISRLPCACHNKHWHLQDKQANKYIQVLCLSLHTGQVIKELHWKLNSDETLKFEIQTES